MSKLEKSSTKKVVGSPAKMSLDTDITMATVMKRVVEIASREAAKEMSDSKDDPKNAPILRTTDCIKKIIMSSIVSEDNESEKSKISDQMEKSIFSLCEQDIIRMNGDENASITELKQELKERTEERNAYKKKFEDAEKRLAVIEASIVGTVDNNKSDEIVVQCIMEEFKKQLAQTSLQLEDRGRIMANQENQINALNNQVASLKEVLAVTKDLLKIRNVEVKHLQAEVDTMEIRILEERERQNAMKNKIDNAARLNEDLKQEYQTQLSLFQELRLKYKQKEQLQSEGKRPVQSAMQSESEKIN